MDVYGYQFGAFLFNFSLVAYPTYVLRKYGPL